MRKLKIYLETTAVSNLDDQRNPERLKEMRALWPLLKQGMYDVVISWVVQEEIENNKNLMKKDRLNEYLSELDYELINRDETIETIAQDIIANNILTIKNYRDCLHIASAMVSNCDCIVSYNFDDINNIRTIKGVQAISMKYGYINMNIVTGGALLVKGENDDTK